MPSDLIGNPKRLAAAAFFGPPCQILAQPGNWRGFLCATNPLAAGLITRDWRSPTRAGVSFLGPSPMPNQADEIRQKATIVGRIVPAAALAWMLQPNAAPKKRQKSLRSGTLDKICEMSSCLKAAR
jgi:hypothetical protein